MSKRKSLKTPSSGQPTAAAPQVRQARDPLGTLFPFLLPLILFLSVTAISRQFAIGFVFLCLILCIGRRPMELLRQRTSLLTGAVILYSGVCLASGLWSHFGEYAGRESVKTLIALSIFGLVLARVRQSHLRRLLHTLNVVLAVVGLLCIDASSLKLLTRVFSWLMRFFHSTYTLARMGYETGIRITGIYSNANVSAGVIAFGLILSLYLIQTAVSRREQLLIALCLGVEALAFFLSFSMGAMAAFALTCLVYLLCAGKNNRLSLLLWMVESVLVTVICAFASYGFLDKNGLPVLFALICGPLIWALNHFVGTRVLSALEGRTRVAGIAVGSLVALLVVYVVLAFSITGGVTLNPNESLSRAVNPDPGAYTVSVEGGDATVQIYTQNDAQLMMHTNTVLYEGDLQSATFTVPEDSSVVWFVLSGDTQLNALSLSDGTKVPLGYRLLPGFAANRLQGLWANQNFIQRIVFFQDGLKLWKASPILGWGVGGVEGQLTSVQSFFYESKYIHNHFIQVLDETGLVGFVSFVLLLGSAVVLLLRRRKEERDPLFAMLGACLTMMIAHSLTEVVWSTQMYQVTVFLVFAVLIIQYHQPKEQQKHAVATGRLAAVALWGLAVVFSLFQAGNVWAEGQLAQLGDGSISQTKVLSALQRMDRFDIYNDTPYKVTLMVNAMQSGGTANRGIAARCARELGANEEYESCYQTAAYYYLPLQQLDGFFEYAHMGLMQEASNPAAWNGVIDLYAQGFEMLSSEHMEDFVTNVADFGTELEAFNQGRMGPILLDAENQAFLDCVTDLAASQTYGDEALWAIAQHLT